jgi:hypothetical protein
VGAQRGAYYPSGGIAPGCAAVAQARGLPEGEKTGFRVPYPQYRAAVLKQHLASLAELGEAVAAEARAAAGVERIRLVERTHAVEWLPSRVASDMVDAVHRAGGDAAVCAFGRSVGRRGFDTAILRPLVVATRGLFGNRPLVLTRFFPQAWRLGTKSCGAIRVESHGRDWARIAHEDVPEELRAEHQLVGVAGVLEGTLILCGAADARAEVVYRPGDARAVSALTWR